MLSQEVLDSITFRLNQISSAKPFELLYYGSRQRGDSNSNSDFNFYLLADPSDQLKSSFIREVSAALEFLEETAPVNLIAGDSESFKNRMRLFEPTSVHLLELSEFVYGDDLFHSIKEEWGKLKSFPPDSNGIVKYLRKRYKFYRSISPRNTKEDISRLEKLLSLYLQKWIFKNVEDLSIPEIIAMDIPSRLPKLIRTLYKSYATDHILEIVSLYEDVNRTKIENRSGQVYPAEKLDQLKEMLRFEDNEIRILKLNH